MIESLIGFAVLITLIFLRVPLFIALALVGVTGFAYLQSPSDSASVWDAIGAINWKPAVAMISIRFIETAQEYGFSVIPLFIYMGNMITRVGLSQQLYDASYAFLGHRKGGLAMATVVSCGGFASVSGSSLATVATMSQVAMPAMKKHGYSDQLATASIAAGGTLGILIPPSVVLIIYGILTETSIRELFAAGFIPGLLGVLFYLVAINYVVWRRPDSGPAGEWTPWQDRWQALKPIWALLLLFLVVLGGIYAGIFTPTEAAGIGAGGATMIALIRRSLNWTILITVLKDTVKTSAVLFAVIIATMALTSFVTRAGLPNELLSIVQSLEVSPMMVMLTIMGIYLLLGMVFDGLSMVLLTVPIFFPLVAGLGLDLVWFGILVVVVTEISLITPPIGMNIFVLSSLLPKVSTTDIFRGVTPFWVVDIARLAILLLFPAISLFLPELLYRNG